MYKYNYSLPAFIAVLHYVLYRFGRVLEGLNLNHKIEKYESLTETPQSQLLRKKERKE